MKKTLLIALTFVLATAAAVAQSIIQVNTNITTNTTWTNNNIYLLNANPTSGGGFLYVTNNAELTIQPGTLILGDKTALVITRGAKIHATGTPTQPIVMTSAKPAGQRARADWGGLLVLGNAVINDPAGSRAAEGGIDPVLGLYGGTNDADNSGEIQYVRIEFAGIAFQANSETNGLTMGGVGTGTTIDHVEVSFGGDDAFEWFGGKVNSKYLVAHRGLDDDFDTDYGYSGNVQFGLAIRDSLVSDNPSISVSNGFESDNDGSGTTNGPRTNAKFSNITDIGPKARAVVPTSNLATGFGRALHLRRSTQLDCYNSVFTGYLRGLKIEGANTFTAVSGGALEFKNNVLAGFDSTNDLDSTAGVFNMRNWFNNNGNSVLASPTAIQLTNPYNYTAPNAVPLAGSPLLSGASFASANLQDPFFTPTTYKGAFDGTDAGNWTKCWCEFDAVNAVYSAPINYAPAQPTIAGTTSFCSGSSTTLSAPSGFAKYTWSTGATTESIVANGAGTYTVTVETARGCTATASVTTTFLAAPTASITGTTTVCQGDAATLTANGAASYLWSNNSASATINPTTAGAYTVTATAANGCTATASTNVVVNALPVATITANGNTSFCLGGSVVLTANSASAYLWSNGETAQNTTVSSTDTLTVVITDANGCVSEESNQIIVTASSSPAPSISGSTTACVGETVTLTASLSDSYAWSNGATTRTITVSATAAGTQTFTVTTTNANPCDGTGPSSAYTVTFNALPTANFTSNLNSFGYFEFTNASTGAVDYTWDFGDNNGYSIAANPTYRYLVDGTYTVTLIATTANGCDATYTTTVTAATGVNTVNDLTNISMFPNPTTGNVTLTLDMATSGAFNVAIMNINGQVVFSQSQDLSAGTQNLSLETSALAAGTYMVTLQSATTIKTLRLVVLK